MKKALRAGVLFVFLTLNFASALAQSGAYAPIPDSGAVWNFRETSSWCGSIADYSIMTDGDSLIGGVLYHKLYTPFVATAISSCIQAGVGYRGAFRNDSAASSVYYLPPLDSVEQLLYDFTWQQGDTVQGWLRSTGISPAVIDRVDSVLVGNEYRSRIHVDCYDVDLIEGVGSTYGLITGLPGCVTDVNDIRLECFSVNGQTFLPDTVSDCILINAVEHLDDIFPISVYPVPANGPLCFRAQHQGTFDLQLFDVTGKCIYTNAVELIPGREVIVETDDLPSGVIELFLTDRSSGKVFTNKVVILR
jgi:hypothetical protein